MLLLLLLLLSCFSHVRLCATLWTTTCQAPLSMGILQARILERVAMHSSKGSSWPRDWTQVSITEGEFFTMWATREVQEYWSGLPIPSPGDLPNLGIEYGPPALQVDSLPSEPPGKLSEKVRHKNVIHILLWFYPRRHSGKDSVIRTVLLICC